MDFCGFQYSKIAKNRMKIKHEIACIKMFNFPAARRGRKVLFILDFNFLIG